jgi:hypothetical protein
MEEVETKRRGRPKGATAESMVKYLECAEAGMTQAETARWLGVSREAVSHFSKRYNIAFRHSGIGACPRNAASQLLRAATIVADIESLSDEGRKVYGHLRRDLGLPHSRAMAVLS